MTEAAYKKPKGLLEQSAPASNTTVNDVINWVTYLAYGVLQGMSYGSTDLTCQAGLANVIYYANQAYSYREFYIPSNSMNFALASQNFLTAYNTIYSYGFILVVLTNSF
jgi:hypothetical protein